MQTIEIADQWMPGNGGEGSRRRGYEEISGDEKIYS